MVPRHGLAETFRDISPIEDFTGQLRLELEFDPTDPDLRPPPKFSVEECKEKDMTYSAPIFVRARFMNATTGEIKEQTVFMGDFPMMTDKGTFIINGTERVVVSQLVRSPGVIFQPGRDAKTVVTGTIHPYRGEWIEFDVEAKPGKDITAGTRVARKRRLSLFVLLRALGYDEEATPAPSTASCATSTSSRASGRRSKELAPTREEALSRSTSGPVRASRRRWSRPTPTSRTPSSTPSATTSPGSAATSSTASSAPRSRRSRRSSTSTSSARPEGQGVLSPARCWPPPPTCSTWPTARPATASTTRTTSPTAASASVGELIQNQVRVGLSRMERVVRERMTTQDVEAITPQTLINIRPVVAAIKEFFGTSQLSPVHGPAQPAVGPHPQAPPVGHGPRRPLP